MLHETICNDDFRRNTVTQKVDPVHADDFLRIFRNSQVLICFGCVAVFFRGCLEESGKEQKVRWSENLHCGHKVSAIFDKSKMASRSRLMNTEEALKKISADRDSDLGEECPLDGKEDVSKYSDISCELEDVIESTVES